jgi:uncharacterized membrane protein
MKQRTMYAIMAAGGAVGLVASFLQMLEKITLLKNANAELACNLNSVFSCSNVLNAWQSSVFGFPNSMMCMVLFTIFGSIGLAGALGGKLTRGLRLGIQGLSLFTLGFGLWFLEQSIYAIGSLCIFCIFCFSGLLLVNWGWLRLNAADLPIGARGRAWVERAVASGADVFIWIVIALVLAFAMILKFA